MSKILLYPVAFIYGFITSVRNYLYNRKVLKSVKFDFPIIGIGNLTVGGTGKTPHTEYLIHLLQYVYKVATLSRGYGRKSTGFLIAEPHTPAALIGDEPRQFKLKFPETIVAVGEDRVMAVPKILDARPDVDVLLMDDAYQHRSIRPGLSVLLTEYSQLFTRDFLFPVGWLREAKNNYSRADIIIVTKCPAALTAAERQQLIAEINPFKYQKVYFSTIEYGTLYSFTDLRVRMELDKNMNVLLVSGIAKHKDLLQHVEQHSRKVYLRDYRDHHQFDRYDLEAIRDTFNNLGQVMKILVTTEKDATRLEEFRSWFLQNKIEIFVQPVRVKFLGDDGMKFDADIRQYIETTKIKLQQEPN